VNAAHRGTVDNYATGNDVGVDNVDMAMVKNAGNDGGVDNIRAARNVLMRVVDTGEMLVDCEVNDIDARPSSMLPQHILQSHLSTTNM
jgi:hypothetical protein